MERRSLGAGLAVLAASLFLLAGTASARTTGSAAPAVAKSGTSCVVNSLPNFIAQGEFGNGPSVADIVEIHCNPAVYGTESTLTVEDPQLFSSCKGNLTWFEPNPFKEAKKKIGIEVEVDVDGNATVAVLGGPGCTVGETFVTVHQNEFPFESFFAGFNVKTAQVTPPGLTAMPESQVEDANSSSVATIVEAEFADSAEKHIRISSEELLHRCQNAPHLKWVEEGGKVVTGKASVEGIELDNDGNAFVIAIGDDSCAEGASLISADEETKPFTTEMTDFTIEPPKELF
jgi:hypothetical protein